MTIEQPPMVRTAGRHSLDRGIMDGLCHRRDAHKAAVGQGAALEPGTALLSKLFALAALATKVRAMIESWSRSADPTEA